MASTAEQYAAEIRKELGYLAAWTPGTPITVGTIGTLDDGVFEPRGNLSTSA
jgi:hypothetical protein